MSRSLTVIEQTEFDNMVKADYQSMGNLLRPTVYQKTNIGAEFIQFRKIGELISEEVTYQDSLTPQDPQYGKATATMVPWAASTLTAKLQELTVNVDDRRENAMLAAAAMRRRSDQIIINAMNASTPGNTIAADFGSSSGNTNLSFEKIKEIVKIFDSQAIPPEDRYFALTADQQSDLFDIIQFTDSRYTNIGPNTITSGSVDGSKNMSMNFVIIPTMREGGLTASSNIRNCYAWHRRSIGIGFASDVMTEINYIPKQLSYLVTSHMLAGATVIDDEGLIKVLCDESA